MRSDGNASDTGRLLSNKTQVNRMKIAFFSNFLNHHQLPLCQALAAQKDVEFVFVATEQIPQERLNMGYSDMNTQYSFVVRAYESAETEAQAQQIADTCDVMILGAGPVRYLENRMQNNLLTFRFCERSLKKGTWRRFIPRTRKKIYEGYTKYKNKRLYVLGASSYTVSDLALCGFDSRKCFRWGYFPAIENKNLETLFSQKRENKVPEILYAGRLIKLKHVMDTVKAVHRLVKDGIPVHFTIIGDGECAREIKAYICRNHLEDYIQMLPFIPPEQVRSYMDRADIYVFGSNFYEGWGAVVNEAMNSGCAVVVSHAVGCAAYLIDSGTNGYVYRFADVDELTRRLAELTEDAGLRERLGTAAYETVTQVWTAEVAARRLLQLCRAISVGGDGRNLFPDGPCSATQQI